MLHPSRLKVPCEVLLKTNKVIFMFSFTHQKMLRVSLRPDKPVEGISFLMKLLTRQFYKSCKEALFFLCFVGASIGFYSFLHNMKIYQHALETCFSLCNQSKSSLINIRLHNCCELQCRLFQLDCIP